MLQNIKSFFNGRIHHHDIVLFSSFLYLVCAMILGGRDPIVTSFLFLVFLTSLFYHSYPKNLWFRLADWIASLGFIYYIGNFVYANRFLSPFSLQVLLVLSIITIASWIISFFSFLRNHNIAYNIFHTLWHLFSGIIVFLLIFSF